MIKLSYQKVPQEYFDFIDIFKGKIIKWLNDGHIGYSTTQVNLCDECKVIFRYLSIGDNLKKYLLLNARDFQSLISFVESKYPQLKADRILPPKDNNTPHSDLYKCLYRSFVKLGYDDSDFPNYQLTESLELKTCPYCNAEEIQYQTINKGGVNHCIMDSELDHFYPKSRIPYLAISIHNLVPSGRICNGANGKHDHDTFALKLINPFTLDDCNGFSFELDCFYAGVLDYRKFIDSCTIHTLTPDPRLKPNKTTFMISQRYQNEREKARKVWMLYKEVSSKGYNNLIEEKKRQLEIEEYKFEEWLDNELEIDSVHYKKKLSKFCIDIWWYLQRVRYQ